VRKVSRYRRSGALFQGRFKAILVQEEGYACTLSRYVHLNPVRAGIVNRARQYPWSSFRDFLDPRGAPSWLDWHAVLAQVGGDEAQSRQVYVRFVEAGLRGGSISSPLNDVVAGALLGSQSWVEQIKARVGGLPAQSGVPTRRLLALRPTLPQIEEAVCETWGLERTILSASRRHGDDARMAAVYLAREVAGLPVTELAQRFGAVSPSAISRLLARGGRRRCDDVDWDQQFGRLATELNGRIAKRKIKT
jgi:putative transposase